MPRSPQDNQSSGESDRGGDATEVEAVKLEMTVMTMEMMLRRNGFCWQRPGRPPAVGAEVVTRWRPAPMGAKFGSTVVVVVVVVAVMLGMEQEQEQEEEEEEEQEQEQAVKL
ncbi:hypothetical protein AK812_SmicGene2997 [Symbiodinium microadriaticum]|uniref:Uncharacterized protein n=1 Tax=Symbiodinium microadriaticum TaxID=2951 RepID=A0A1Q9EZX1_SYMMI|nr:hypothetical protein AK812_SmicGene2997 [Symbiodinium microadriaticum]